MVGHKRERVLGRVGRAVNAAARDFAREAAQLENGGGREAAAERLVNLVCCSPVSCLHVLCAATLEALPGSGLCLRRFFNEAFNISTLLSP